MQESSVDSSSGLSGPEAIAAALRTFSTKDVEDMAREGLESKKQSQRGPSVKLMRYAHGLKRNSLEPEDYLIKRVPVIPPKFRPFNVVGDSFLAGDANELYKDLFEVRDSYTQLRDALGEEASKESKLHLYDAARAAYGFADPVLPKTKQRGVSGFLKKITGSQAKYGYFQRKLLSKPVDSSGRGVIGVNPDLDLDEIGIPKEMGWKLYAPYIQRRLVRSGMSPSMAITAIRDKTAEADRAMELESKERPVIYSRAPAWHKFNVTSGFPKFIEGNTIMINPLVTSGHNADFDGDAMNVQVPSIDEAVRDAREKLLPSKMLFSIKKRGEVVPKPAHEFVLGLYTAQNRPATRQAQAPDEATALRAIKAGQISLDDDIILP